MSDLGSSHLQEDLRALTQAIQALTLAVEGQPSESSPLAQRPSRPVSTLEGWQLVEDSAPIAGAPLDFTQKEPVILFEEGPPDTPQFCYDLAKKRLSSAKANAADRARAAYVAGFWARAFWKCHTDYHSDYKPGLQAVHWVLRKGEGFDLLRVTSQRDCDRLVAEFEDIVFLEKLPSLTELNIFCAGATVPVPPLWRWNGGR